MIVSGGILSGGIVSTWVVVTVVYFLVLDIQSIVFTVVSWLTVARYERARSYFPAELVFESPLTPGISVLVPAYNEELGIVQSVSSLLALRYPMSEVIVVNDGSTDTTLERLREAFDLIPVRHALRDSIASEPVLETFISRTNPDLVVLDKLNGGKSDALNAGLRVAHHPLFCSVDADSLMDADALLEVVRPFLEDPELAIGSGGIVRISNGCTVDHGRVVEVGLPRKLLPALQAVEYVRAFLVGRLPWSRLNAMMIISGAFGVFRHDAATRIGGYRRETVGEDADLVMRLHRDNSDARRPYKIEFVPMPVVWTEGPSDISTLAQQRRRWQRGLGQVLWNSKVMFLRPRYGWLGILTMPVFLIYEFLGPVFAVLGLLVTLVGWVFNAVTYRIAIASITSVLLLGALSTLSALWMDQLGERQRLSNRDLRRATVYSFLEAMGYSQFIEICQIWGYIDLIRRKKAWGTQRRHGFDEAAET